MCATQLCAGLLHDTVEDTDLEFGDIDVLFGPTVRKIVEGETKVSKLPKMVRRHCCFGDRHSMLPPATVTTAARHRRRFCSTGLPCGAAAGA